MLELQTGAWLFICIYLFLLWVLGFKLKPYIWVCVYVYFLFLFIFLGKYFLDWGIIFSFFFFFNKNLEEMRAEFHSVTQASLNSWSFCLCLLTVRIIMHHCTVVLTFPHLHLGKIGKGVVVGIGSCYIIKIGLDLILCPRLVLDLSFFCLSFRMGCRPWHLSLSSCCSFFPGPLLLWVVSSSLLPGDYKLVASVPIAR